MPGTFAHMFIFEDVIAEIEKDSDCEDLVKLLKENKNYGTLGSLGPDLPTFESVTGTLYSHFTSATDEPFHLEKWSGQLHSKDPNVFPLKMIEIAWKENDFNVPGWDNISKRQWAFIIGFLCHIAADQTIHPFINSIAGQIYRSKESRLKHGEAEAYQDVVLYTKKKGKRIQHEKLKNWIDVSVRSKRTDPFFSVFIQKAFIEAHSVCPSDKEIKNWFRGLSTVFFILGLYGRYIDADKDFRSKNESSEKYKEFWLKNSKSGDKSYMDYYHDAVELASIYAKTGNQLYKMHHAKFGDPQRLMFLEIVKNADLTNPLDDNILADARKAYMKYFGK
jgi:hypothetical protein